MKTHIARLSVLAFAASASAQPTVAPLLTRAWENHRSGWNQQETLPTPSQRQSQGHHPHHHHPRLRRRTRNRIPAAHPAGRHSGRRHQAQRHDPALDG
jgi:hypothetical protein